MKLKDTIKIWLIILAIIAGILCYLVYWGTIGITWGAVFPLVIFSLVIFVILIPVHLLFERVIIPHWIRTILFLIILGLLFLLPIIPIKMPAECLVPPCGYYVIFASLYKFLSYLFSLFSGGISFNLFSYLSFWATAFTYPLIVLEIVAAYFLSKPAAGLVGKIKAKLSEKAKSD